MSSPPLTYEEWKAIFLVDRSESEYVKPFERLYSINYKEMTEEVLKTEYEEYKSNFNGNWLLR